MLQWYKDLRNNGILLQGVVKYGMIKQKVYEEKIPHGTAEIPIALHKLAYKEGTDIVFYLHWHRELEILVLTDGLVEVQVEEQIYVLHKGEAIFINSNMYHSARSLDGKGCSFYALVFSYEFLQNDLHTHFGRHYIRPVLKSTMLFTPIIRRSVVEDGNESTIWQTELLDCLDDINELDADQLLDSELRLKADMYRIWQLYYEHAVMSDVIDDDSLLYQERIKPVLEFIEQNYTYEVTIAELAGLIPMSEGQFCRIFKQTMNRTPMQYIMRYRIMQSCRMLIDTNKKIAEIANETGFNNISYYNKVFLNIVGCTPKQYRRSNF